MTAEAGPSGLHAKLSEVMAAISHIEKGGHNDAQRYDYTRQADVVAAVRAELSQRKVTCVPQTIDVVESRDYESKSGGRQHFLLIRTEWLFTDAETGETQTVQALGAGTDSGDKSPYKAMTGASKYAELLAFLIPTGDDPEKPNEQDKATEADMERLELLGRIKGQTGIVKKGSGRLSNLEAKQTADDGMVFGFRLEKIGGKPDKHIPQVVLDGNIGAVYVTAHGDPAELVGKTVTVSGLLYAVRAPKRQVIHRLLVETIEGEDWKLPADPEEAPSVPMFSESEDAAIDAALDREKEAMALFEAGA